MADGDVNHHRDHQLLLKRLKEAGVLLIALSKNSPENIRWSEMELSPDDFVLQKIGWRPKPDGVSEAVAELDLAATAFVLLDDNPAERALVTEQVAGVIAVDPADAAAWRGLERWLSFPSTKQTEEAKRHTEIYREAAERRESMAGSHDYKSMMRTLGLICEFRIAPESDRDPPHQAYTAHEPVQHHDPTPICGGDSRIAVFTEPFRLCVEPKRLLWKTRRRCCCDRGKVCWWPIFDL